MVIVHPDSKLARDMGKNAPSPVYPLGTAPLAGAWDDETRESLAIPRKIRIEIPLTSQVGIRCAADLLRGLATDLEVLSRRTDISETEVMINVYHRLKQTHQNINAHTKSGSLRKR